MRNQNQEHLQIYLLGPSRLVVNGDHVPNSAWRSKKALSLFKYLLAYRERKMRKEVLLELFWPDESNAEADSRLYTAIYSLRRMLQPDLAPYQDSLYIRHSNGMYWFDTNSPCWLDVDEFERLHREGSQLEDEDPSLALARYQEAFALYRGDFLTEEPYADWAIALRDNYRERFIVLSLRLSQLLVREESDVTEAVRICRRALSEDPYREELHQMIMSHLIEAGRFAEAATQYRQLCTMLA